MWAVVVATVIAVSPPSAPPPDAPYVSCRDGTVLPPESVCPEFKPPDADASGGGGTGGPRSRGRGGLLGLGIGGIL